MKEVKLHKILIFGNSGSGKSTLAKQLSGDEGIAHLDLDTLAWQPTEPPQRKSLEQSQREIDAFLGRNGGWVIEGCYADLLAFVADAADEMIFLDLPVENCIANARRRLWEPHKYPSKAAQDANLDMLIDWIAAYSTREDEFSRTAHEALFMRFHGRKQRYP
ncbi:MAG: AAA family ATPase [Exilibacterium sp.]